MCYTVLVVDDETEQRHAIVERVKWKEAGFRVVGDAENGIEALDMVETLEPDLILTDIRMPLMTGLELAEQVHQMRPATQMVFLSGYDNFEYAQEAIRYNTIGYLLKPISSAELSRELFHFKERMDQRFEELRGPSPKEAADSRLERAEFLLPLLLGNSEEAPDEDRLHHRAEALHLVEPGQHPHYGVLVSKYKNAAGEQCTNESHIGFVDAVIGKYVKTESFFVNGRIVTLVITDSDHFVEQMQLPLRELVQNAQRILGQRCTVGASRGVDRLCHCGNACFQAITARRYTSDGAGNIRFIEDQEHGNGCQFEFVEKSVYTLEQLLKVGSEEKIVQFLDDLYAENSRESNDYLAIQVLATAHRSVGAVSDQAALAELITQNPIFLKASSFDYESEIRTDLTKLCLSARDIISRYQKRDTEVLCDKVVHIIDTEYGNENLSLTDVSSRLNVSPNYLSSLIKKTKKKNFVALVTERRMKAAYDLLLCTTMKIMEIAEKCGYSDQHYFSYCFKKYYGESPNRIREQHKEGDR